MPGRLERKIASFMDLASVAQYRRNVAIVICNSTAQVLWARRISHDGWQFPQGGIDPDETPDEAVYRELEEELGLKSCHVKLLGSTKTWFKYDIPNRFNHDRLRRNFRGQEQKWFLFQFLGSDSDFCLDCSSRPEFDDWKWVDYWIPADQVVDFKRAVYREALIELEPLTIQIN